MPILQWRGLTRTFAATPAVDNVSLDVEEGEILALLGPSGSGKSTLLSLIGGLDRASSGELRVGEWLLSSLPERRLAEYRATTVGFVFQFHYLLKDFDAVENVALPAYMRGEPRSSAFERARRLLDDVELGTRLHHFPAQLSGGERQRAAIARALVNAPPLVLADEPTGNLDSASARKVRELLFGLSPRYGTTLILVTHDRELAEQADRRYELQDGCLRSV